MPDDALKGKAAVKIGMQYGKLITDSRFYKPPKWKRKNSFRAIANAVRECAVCLHRSFAALRWVDQFLDGTILQIDRDATRLDGARGKKQIWHPPFSNLGSSGSKCTALKNVHCCVTLLGHFGVPAIIRRPCSISAPPECFGARVIAPPLAPRYAPADWTIMQRVKSYRRIRLQATCRYVTVMHWTCSISSKNYNLRQVFLRCFRDPIRVPKIENWVPRIRVNYHRVPRIREIGSLQVHNGYLTFSLKKTLSYVIMQLCNSSLYIHGQRRGVLNYC